MCCLQSLLTVCMNASDECLAYRHFRPVSLETESTRITNARSIRGGGQEDTQEYQRRRTGGHPGVTQPVRDSRESASRRNNIKLSTNSYSKTVTTELRKCLETSVYWEDSRYGGDCVSVWQCCLFTSWPAVVTFVVVSLRRRTNRSPAVHSPLKTVQFSI